MTVIGNGLDLGSGVSGGSLYNVTDGHSAMTLTFDGSDGALSRTRFHEGWSFMPCDCEPHRNDNVDEILSRLEI